MRVVATAPAPATTTAATGASSPASSGSPSRPCSCSSASGPRTATTSSSACPELTGEQRVEMGNLYRLLRALEEEGLVSSEWDATSPGPAKRRYALTETGARLLDQWVEALRELAGAHQSVFSNATKQERR